MDTAVCLRNVHGHEFNCFPQSQQMKIVFNSKRLHETQTSEEKEARFKQPRREKFAWLSIMSEIKLVWYTN